MKFDVSSKEDWALIGRIRIYLDGIEVHTCVMADEAAGVIERWETDEQGHVIAFRHRNGVRPRRIRERGIVRIERKECSADE